MNIDYRYLRPRKAAMLRERYDLMAAGGRRPLRFETLEDAVVIPPADKDHHECGVSVEVAQSADCMTEECAVYFAGYLNRHWGHFLVDVLSRLWLLFDARCPAYDKVIFAVAPEEGKGLPPTVEEALRYVGVLDRMEIIDTPCRYRRVIAPEAAVAPREYYSPQTLAVYERIAQSAMAEIRRSGDFASLSKILLSRARLKKARDNEPGIISMHDFFDADGYRPIYPEQLTLARTIAYIRGAETVACASGTLTHNMLFARPGQRLVVIEKTPMINNYQQGVDLIKGLHATYIDANAQIMSVSQGLGPFIMYPNEYLRAFARDEGMSVADWSDGEKRQALRRYFRMYARHYSRRWIMEPWEECEIGLMAEAYDDSYRDFGAWLSGGRPIFVSDLLSPRRLLKRLYHLYKNRKP